MILIVFDFCLTRAIRIVVGMGSTYFERRLNFPCPMLGPTYQPSEVMYVASFFIRHKRVIEQHLSFKIPMSFMPVIHRQNLHLVLLVSASDERVDIQ